jgi:hypothetical protein
VLGSAHSWAGCQLFKRIELRESVLSAVSVIGQDCDEVFWHYNKNKAFSIQSQIHARPLSGFVMYCQVFSASWNTMIDKNNHFNYKQTIIRTADPILYLSVLAPR